MFRSLAARSDAFALATPFRISRGVKTVADVVTVSIAAEGAVGWGEGVPYPRYGESLAGALAEIAAVRGAIEGGASREELLALMPAGAARNAVDCALWDLEAKLAGRSVTELLGMAPLGPTATAMTVMATEPAMAFNRPPASPGGGVISVKTATLRPASPFHNSAPRISASQARPMPAATMHSVIITELRALRRL